MRKPLLILGLVLGVLAVAFWATGGLAALEHAAVAAQRDVQNALAKALRALKTGQPGAVAGLLALSFGYGFFHAAGPGHGKMLIGGYGMGSRVPSRAAGRHRAGIEPGAGDGGCRARLCGHPRAGLDPRATGGRGRERDDADQLRRCCHTWLVACVARAAGDARAARERRRQSAGGGNGRAGAPRPRPRQPRPRRPQSRRPGHAGHTHDHSTHDHHHAEKESPPHGHAPHGHPDHVHDASCGHAHGPTLDEIARVRGWRDALALIAGIAMRPCTGALFVLILTWQMGIARDGHRRGLCDGAWHRARSRWRWPRCRSGRARVRCRPCRGRALPAPCRCWKSPAGVADRAGVDQPAARRDLTPLAAPRARGVSPGA